MQPGSYREVNFKMPVDTRERILAAALKLFAEKGYEGATTKEIAREAGYAEGTIYRHFQDKKDLFLACIEPAVRTALERGLSDVNLAPDLRAMVRGMLSARLQTFREHMDAFNLLFTEARYHPELLKSIFERVFMARAAELIPAVERIRCNRETQRVPSFRIMGIGLTMAVWGILMFQDQVAAMPAQYPAGVSGDDLLEELTDFVLYGIAGQPAGGGPST